MDQLFPIFINFSMKYTSTIYPKSTYFWRFQNMVLTSLYHGFEDLNVHVKAILVLKTCSHQHPHTHQKVSKDIRQTSR